MPDTSATPLAFRQHNHQQCISQAMQHARQICLERGLRLTPLREQVLQLIVSSHKPLGAYTLLEQLSANATRRIAPPTVYRALDFLQQQQLVHRIACLNAYIGCSSPARQHCQFLICRHCETTVEIVPHSIATVIEQTARDADFAVETHHVEIVGLCPRCRQRDLP